MTTHFITVEKEPDGWQATCSCDQYRSRFYRYGESHAARAAKAHLGAVGVEPGDPIATGHESVKQGAITLMASARAVPAGPLTTALIRHCEIDLLRLSRHWPMRDRVNVWCNEDLQPWPCHEFQQTATAIGISIPIPDQPARQTPISGVLESQKGMSRHRHRAAYPI